MISCQTHLAEDWRSQTKPKARTDRGAVRTGMLCVCDSGHRTCSDEDRARDEKCFGFDVIEGDEQKKVRRLKNALRSDDRVSETRAHRLADGSTPRKGDTRWHAVLLVIWLPA